MPHTHHASVESARVSAGLILAALIYLRGWVRIRRLNGHSLGGWRSASFTLGFSFIWVATASPLAALDHDILTAHMVQHLLLMTFAPPLILLGGSVKTFAYGLPHRFVQVMGQLFQSTGLRQVWSALTHPAICWLGAACTLIAWHIPSMFALGLQSEMWHWLEQASFLATGLL